MKRRRLLGGLTIIGFLLSVATGLVAWAYFALHHIPVFYGKAKRRPVAEQTKSADHFEKQVLELHNETHRDGRWQVALTEEEMNGWLTMKLPANFPTLLPPSIDEPRVSIENQTLLVGCRYTDSWLATIFNLTLEPFLTENKNEIAIRVRAARAGSFPIPLRRLIEIVTQATQKAKIEIRWQQLDGDPVAIFTLPPPTENNPQYELDGLELKEGRLVITGRTLGNSQKGK